MSVLVNYFFEFSCVKFQTKLKSFSIIIAISFGVNLHFNRGLAGVWVHMSSFKTKPPIPRWLLPLRRIRWIRRVHRGVRRTCLQARVNARLTSQRFSSLTTRVFSTERQADNSHMTSQLTVAHPARCCACMLVISQRPFYTQASCYHALQRPHTYTALSNRLNIQVASPLHTCTVTSTTFNQRHLYLRSDTPFYFPAV